MTEGQHNATPAEQTNIIPLTDLEILTDKAKRIMNRERKTGSKSFFLPVAELFRTAVALDRRRKKTETKTQVK